MNLDFTLKARCTEHRSSPANQEKEPLGFIGDLNKQGALSSP